MPPLTKERSAANNDRLRKLIDDAGLTKVEALNRFNEGLHPLAQCSAHSWKSYFSEVDSERWRHVRKEVLEHAESVFRAISPRKTARTRVLSKVVKPAKSVESAARKRRSS